MLTELQIHNFLIIEALNLSFESGMTVITGETGAGKSILLDALQFVAGGRADSKSIRNGKESCEITAQFLQKGEEVVLKRILTVEGRNKAYINGNLVSVGELKTMGSTLLNWVGQYEHQALLKTEAQLQALDRFAKDEALLTQVTASSQTITQLKQHLQELQAQAQKQQEAGAFKTYQLEILQSLSIAEHELESLYQEQKRLAAGESVLSQLAQMLNVLHEDEQNLTSKVKRLERDAHQLAGEFTELENAARLCSEATVNLGEAYHELKAFYDVLELDPARLQEVESRLSEIHATARKLQLNPKALFAQYQTLQNELQGLGTLNQEIKQAEESLKQAQTEYHKFAKKLTQARFAAGEKLSSLVTLEIKTLGMQEGEFKVSVQTDLNSFSSQGQDRIEFLVRMNPGQKPGSLKDSASGGELSRIALVIAVQNAKQTEAQTLIFDEVDVGVSGAVAEKVGQLLRELGKEAQVLCITHLPQVAMVGQHHIHVAKTFSAGETFGSAKALSREERIEEVARIMSGENITEHARELARVGLM